VAWPPAGAHGEYLSSKSWGEWDLLLLYVLLFLLSLSNA